MSSPDVVVADIEDPTAMSDNFASTGPALAVELAAAALLALVVWAVVTGNELLAAARLCAADVPAGVVSTGLLLVALSLALLQAVRATADAPTAPAARTVRRLIGDWRGSGITSFLHVGLGSVTSTYANDRRPVQSRRGFHAVEPQPLSPRT